MRLPNGERVDRGTKLIDYVLNPAHHEGKHKARRFESVLGITATNAALLETALREQAAESDAAAWREDNGYGDVYVLRFNLTTAAGTAMVLSAWIVRHGEDFPRLTTCYID